MGDMVGERWNRIAALNFSWFINLTESFMSAKSHPSGKYLCVQHLPTIQGIHRSSGATLSTPPAEIFPAHGHYGSREARWHGHRAVVIWLLLQAPCCRDIIETGSREASGKHVAWPPAGFSFSLFQLVTLLCSFSSLTQTCYVSLAALHLPWPCRNDCAKGKITPPKTGP